LPKKFLTPVKDHNQPRHQSTQDTLVELRPADCSKKMVENL
jgi:hypothetical protein